jgi:hypothetical protein
MSTDEPDLLKIIENIKSGATDLYSILKQYEAKIAELQSQISEAELYKDVAEKRAAEPYLGYSRRVARKQWIG